MNFFTKKNYFKFTFFCYIIFFFISNINDALFLYSNYSINLKSNTIRIFLLFFLSLNLFSIKNKRNVYINNTLSRSLILLIGIIYSLILAIINNNYFFFVFRDFEVLFILFLFIKFSMDKEFLEIIIIYLKNSLIFGIILSFIGFLNLTGLDRSSTEKSLLNSFQIFLYPIYFFTLFIPLITRKKDKMIIYTALLIFIVMQVLFQKRLPTIHIFVTIIISFFLISKYKSNLIKSTILIVAILIIPILFFQEQLTGLFTRYTQYGDVIQTARYDGRYDLAYYVYSFLSNTNQIFSGIGLGGIVYGPTFWWTLYLPNMEIRNATDTIEFGAIWPFWKGGVILGYIYYFIILEVIVNFRKKIEEINIKPFYYFILIHFIFLFGENYFNQASILYVTCLGISLGLMYNERNNQKINFVNFHFF